MFSFRSDKCVILTKDVESGIKEAVESNKIACKVKIGSEETHINPLKLCGSEETDTSNHVEVRMLDMHWFY